MSSQSKAGRKATRPTVDARDPLLDWDESAAYIGPSITARWIKRQVYEFRTIKTVAIGGRTMIPKSELDRYLDEALAELGETRPVRNVREIARSRAAARGR